jgi:hypothetical protein
MAGMKEWCWPWAHAWAKWRDLSSTEVVSRVVDGVVGISIKQERRCFTCNQVQLRTEKTTL